MNNIKFFFIIVLFFFWAVNLFAEGQWIPFKTGNTDRDNVNGIAIEGDSIWCATQDGVISWSKKNGNFIYYSTIFEPRFYDDVHVNCVTIDHNGVKWFGKNNRIFSFNNNIWVQYIADNVDLLGQIRNIYNDSFWIDKIIVTNDNRKIFGYQGIYSIGIGNPISRYVGFILSYDDQIWKNLFENRNDGNYFAMALDTIDPNILWYSKYYGTLHTGNLTDLSTSRILGINDSTIVTIISIAVDKNNIIWSGRYDSITSYDRKNFITFPSDTTSIYKSGSSD